MNIFQKVVLFIVGVAMIPTISLTFIAIDDALSYDHSAKQDVSVVISHRVGPHGQMMYTYSK